MIIAMQLIRCVACRTVLMSQGVFKGTLEIKCKKSHCRTINHIEIDRGRARVSIKNDDRLAEGDYTMLN